MKKLATIFALLFLAVVCAWANGHWPAPAGQMRPENDDMLSQLIQQNLRDWQLVESLLTTIPSPTGMAYNGQYFFVGNWMSGASSNLYKIDPATGATVGNLPSPSMWPGGMAWDGQYLWVSDYITGSKLFQISATTGAIISQFSVMYSYYWAGVAWDGANLLYGVNGNPSLPIPGKIIKYSTTGTPLDSMTVPRGYISGLEYYDGHLYYSDSQNDKLFKMLWGGTLVDSTPAANGYPSGLSMQGDLLCNIDHTTKYIYKYSLGAVVPPNVTIDLTPINPPIQIPAGGGSFNFDVDVINGETTPQTFDAWIMVQLPNMTWFGPVLGPISLTLSGSVTLTRTRTQSVPASAPAGSYTYEGRVGDYPGTIWDSDSFPFTKLASGDASAPVFEWTNSGQSFEVAPISVTPSAQVALRGAIPNPFNPTTAISYALPQAGHVTLMVYDLSGCEVATVVNGWRDAGSHQVTFDGSALASGVYVYRLTANGQTASAKMILMK